MASLIPRIYPRAAMIALVAFVGASPLIARAQSPTAEQTSAAKKYVGAGISAQDMGDYDTAITFYTKAYDLVPHPALLFNLGQAHRLAGRIDQAADFYRRYLAAEPAGSEAGVARTVLADLTARSSGSPLELERTSSGRPGRSLRIGGIVAGGAGGAAAMLSVAFAVRGWQLSRELSGQMIINREKVREGEAANRHAIGLGVAGAGLLVGGAVVYWLGHRRQPAGRRLAWSPTMRPDLAGILVSGVLP